MHSDQVFIENPTLLYHWELRQEYLLRLYNVWKRDIGFIPYKLAKELWGPEDQVPDDFMDIEIDLGDGSDDDEDDDHILVDGPSDAIMQEMELLNLDG
jgi:hypothetical protein